MEENRYALVRMTRVDGAWLPSEGQEVTYGITITSAMDQLEEEAGSTYGAWPVRSGTGVTEEIIMSSRPEFMVVSHAGKYCFTSQGASSVQESQVQMYAITGLCQTDGFYVPDEDLWGVHLGSDPVSLVLSCIGGADVRGNGFGVWKADSMSEAKKLIKERLPDMLYVLGPEFQLEKMSDQVITRMLRITT